MPRTTKKLLVTGCGRSGTKSVAYLLRCGGLNVPHERRMGADGISSWLFGVDSRAVPWGPAPEDYSFDYVVQLTRNPLLAIPSIATFNKRSWDYIKAHVPVSPSDPPLLKAAKYWLMWNELIETRAEARLRIEDMPAAIEPVCRLYGLRFDYAKAGHVPTDLNTRRYGRLFHIYENKCLRLNQLRRNTFLKKILSRRNWGYLGETSWEVLESLDPNLTERIRVKSRKYGY